MYTYAGYVRTQKNGMLCKIQNYIYIYIYKEHIVGLEAIYIRVCMHAFMHVYIYIYA